MMHRLALLGVCAVAHGRTTADVGCTVTVVDGSFFTRGGRALHRLAHDGGYLRVELDGANGKAFSVNLTPNTELTRRIMVSATTAPHPQRYLD
jgi:hypothetical protein